MVYLWSLILPRSKRVFLGAEPCLLAVNCQPDPKLRQQRQQKACWAFQHPVLMRTPSCGMKLPNKTAHADAPQSPRGEPTFSLLLIKSAQVEVGDLEVLVSYWIVTELLCFSLHLIIFYSYLLSSGSSKSYLDLHFYIYYLLSACTALTVVNVLYK